MNAMGVTTKNTYRFDCHDADGTLLWSETVENTVPTEGLNYMLTNNFKASSYTAAWYIGLINNTGFSALAAGDTAAKITTSTPSGGTNQWQELTGYSESVRQTLTLGTVASGSVDNTGSVAVFTASGSVTVKGAFVDSSSSKGGTSGKLYGEATLTTARSFTVGQTISVTITLTLASA